MGGVYVPRSPTTGVLYSVVHGHWSDCAAEVRARTDGAGLPAFVTSAFRKFLRCGVLAHGCARVRCGACAFERLVPFSCKGRGVCPSCGGRRMAERAAHLIEHVFPPDVPERQWVFGGRAGRGPLRIGADPEAPWVERRVPLHAHAAGFDLHAAAGDVARLRQLCRYLCRPPLGQERLRRLGDGRVALALPRPWADGTTHLVFTPQELFVRLVPLVPRPRINLVVYHGVLAPNAPWRQAVVARDVVPAPMAEAVTPVSAERPAAGEAHRPRGGRRPRRPTRRRDRAPPCHEGSSPAGDRPCSPSQCRRNPQP